jgi:C4-dicarboxylate-specific signal transduction histidine kinase
MCYTLDAPGRVQPRPPRAALRTIVEPFHPSPALVMADASGITSPLTPEQLARINRVATAARFVSALAHELNNSLQVMSGLVELLADREDLPADVLLRIERIGTHADRASDTIRQVVSYVRERPQAAERLHLGAIVDRALRLRSYELGRAGVAIAWHLPGESFAVRGSASDLHQAILNLLANAQEALADAPARRLGVDLTRTGDRIRLSVTDTGPGVPTDVRQRIFDPFFTTHPETGALGLGLTVASHIAAAHGGDLSLADGTASATRFVLELPEASGAPDEELRTDN